MSTRFYFLIYVLKNIIAKYKKNVGKKTGY